MNWLFGLKSTIFLFLIFLSIPICVWLFQFWGDIYNGIDNIIIKLLVLLLPIFCIVVLLFSYIGSK